MLLLESDVVTLDASGNGVLQMRPDGSREYWSPEVVSEQCTSVTGDPAVNEAVFKLYIGPSVQDQYFVDGTFTGSSGNSTTNVSGYTVGRHASPYIIGVWTGGDAGASATMRIQGSKAIR